MQPDFGHLRWIDLPVILYCVVRMLIYEIPIFLLTYPFHYTHTASESVTTNFKHFLVRVSDEILNPVGIRFLSRPESEHTVAILTSPRYRRYQTNLYQRVLRPEFSGYWILQSSLQARRPPCESEVVIFYTHGGGYFSSKPAHYLLFLLRLAESVLGQGVSVSIFALDYSLAPERTFPTQLEEANAAYRYMLTEEHIPSEKVVFMGDSAGGHLALSLLVYLHKNPFHSADAAALRAPAGLVLMSPWLSLSHQPASFTTNAHRDILSRAFLARTARQFLGRNGPGESPYIEFLHPDPPIDWKDILPAWVWVCAGEHEILFDQIIPWVNMLERSSLRDQRVELEIGRGKVHVWQWLETMMDLSTKATFLKNEVGDQRGFEATVSIGKIIVVNMK